MAVAVVGYKWSMPRRVLLGKECRRAASRSVSCALAVAAAVVVLAAGAGCSEGSGGSGGPTSSSSSIVSVPASPSTTSTVQAIPATGWQRRADAPEPRQEISAAVVGDRVWVVGGITDDGPSRGVESYDPTTDSWRPGPDLPEPLHHAAAVVYRGELVVVGGFAGGGADLYDRPSDRVLALRDGTWVDLPRLRRPRGAAAVAVVGDTLLLVGGRDQSLLIRPTEAFDGTAWSDRAPIPVPRDHLAAATDGRYVYAVGGRYLGPSQTSDSVERYEPATDTWQTLAPLPTARGGHGLTFAGGRLIAVGGEDASRVYPQVEAFDPAANTWASLPPLVTPRHGLGLVAVKGTVYALVGGTAAGVAPSAATESLDLPGATDTPGHIAGT